MFSFCLMQKVFSSLATDFLKNALVVSSIDQHIASLENCINAVTTLYNPKIAPQKAGYYDKFKGCSEKDRKIITKKLQDTPEGIIINHYNTDTGKFNGHTITSKEVGQSFRTCTKQIALQAACGVPIDLWTMVFGGEDEKESYYYYRRDRLSKIVTHGGSHDAHMRVFPSLRPVDEYKAHWGTIGVDVEQHAKLPFAFVRPLKETRRPKKAEDLPASASPMQIRVCRLLQPASQPAHTAQAAPQAPWRRGRA
mmetsp:Transcript_45885/g.110481  ORF Transcript_45885/g.110481 Transcript_45885/m.110481 type:complete len:252 (+) Transcript_45885:464-1219(+)